MRLLLAAVSALLVLGLAAGVFTFLLDSYERRHRNVVTAQVTIDSAGRIRIDGQAIGFDELRARWREQSFRARHCRRWRLEAHPNASAVLGHAVGALIDCR